MRFLGPSGVMGLKRKLGDLGQKGVLSSLKWESALVVGKGRHGIGECSNFFRVCRTFTFISVFLGEIGPPRPPVMMGATEKKGKIRDR